jgi:hypothetical protein
VPRNLGNVNAMYVKELSILLTQLLSTAMVGVFTALATK